MTTDRASRSCTERAQSVRGKGAPGFRRPQCISQSVRAVHAGAGYSLTFFTNCDFSPIWPIPGTLQSIS